MTTWLTIFFEWSRVLLTAIWFNSVVAVVFSFRSQIKKKSQISPHCDLLNPSGVGRELTSVSISDWSI